MGVQITGMRDTANILQDRREMDFTGIHDLWANQTPLAAILAKMNKKSSFNSEFTWFERQQMARITRINNGGGYPLGSETSLVVDDSTIFVVNDVVHNTRTGENMLITAINYTTHTLTVTRNLGGAGAGSAINDNDEMLAIHSTYAEGTASGTAISTKAVKKYNYTQIFKTAIKLTGTVNAQKLRGGEDLEDNLREAALRYSTDVERALLFGKRNEDTSGSTPIRQTGGITDSGSIGISTNVTDNSGASITEAQFLAHLRPLYENGDSDVRTSFCPHFFLQKVGGWADSKVRITQSVTSLGIVITEYVSPYGRTNLIPHRLLKGDIYGYYVISLDLPRVMYRFLQGRDTKLQTNIQNNDEDLVKHQFIGEVGGQLVHETLHGILHNWI